MDAEESSDREGAENAGCDDEDCCGDDSWACCYEISEVELESEEHDSCAEGVFSNHIDDVLGGAGYAPQVGDGGAEDDGDEEWAEGWHLLRMPDV